MRLYLRKFIRVYVYVYIILLLSFVFISIIIYTRIYTQIYIIEAQMPVSIWNCGRVKPLFCARERRPPSFFFNRSGHALGNAVAADAFFSVFASPPPPRSLCGPMLILLSSLFTRRQRARIYEHADCAHRRVI